MTLPDIGTTWQSYKSTDQVTRHLMTERLTKCDGCPNKRQLSTSGGILMANADNEVKSVFYCGLCGCPLANKVGEALNACPEGRWPAVPKDESFYN